MALEDSVACVGAIVPRDHQVEALDGLIDTLGRSNRAQAHMCCGSGKTYTQAFLGQWVLEDVEDPASAVLVCFVPNRGLIHQNARNFRKVFGSGVEYLGVCSDSEMADAAGESGLDTTTDAQTVVRFLMRRNRPRVVVCTYQSGRTLRAAFAQARGADAAVDLGLFDEAHRTAGNKSTDALFAFALIDANFPMDRRAFFTATPRVVESKTGDSLSMANPDMYGPVAYTYPFSRGIRDGNVVDYVLWVPVITRAELAAFMRDRGLEGEERAVVAMIALEKVMEKTGQGRFLSYHNRISASQAFAESLQQALGAGVLVAHVDGSTPAVERDRLMAALSAGRTILTNCKAFVEGVDAPGLQGVLFVDHRKSVVDVVQAVGRLSRPDPLDSGKRGSIIAPILVETADMDGLHAAAARSGFSTLVEVVQALRANDDSLDETVLEASRALGRGDGTVPVLPKMEVLGPEDAGLDAADLAQALTVVALGDMRDGFAENVGRLEAFIAAHGHLPTRDGDARLYAWVSATRKRHAQRCLEPVHAALLDGVEGWYWVGERTPPATIAAHIAAFRDRTQRMPSGKRGGGAEADLHAYLMEGQEEYLRKGPLRSGKLTQALVAANLLFFAEEVLGKRAQQSGRFEVRSTPGGHEVIFHPRPDAHRTTVPVFRSGHTVAPRPIVVQVGRAERERLAAMTSRHSARVTLVRAGVEADPFRDGRVLEWHAGSVDRGETADTSKVGFVWLLSRLWDRKVSGREPYSRAALDDKRIAAHRPATILNPVAPRGTVGEVVGLIERVRTAGLAGRVQDTQMRLLDGAPGFSWMEPSEAPDAWDGVVAYMVGRVGVEGLAAPEQRAGDTGLAATLRVLDDVVEASAQDPGLAAVVAGTKTPGALAALYQCAAQQGKMGVGAAPSAVA